MSFEEGFRPRRHGGHGEKRITKFTLNALAIDRRMKREIPDWILPEADLVALIKAFHEKKLWMESVPAMVEYISRNAEKTPLMRLNLARILVVEGKRPLQALKVLAKIDPATLDAAQQGVLEKIRAKARQLHEQDPYEVADEDW
jgi:hypothetical protein